MPTIDQCYTDDVTCFYEANEQFKRDQLVTQLLKYLSSLQEYGKNWKDIWDTSWSKEYLVMILEILLYLSLSFLYVFK